MPLNWLTPTLVISLLALWIARENFRRSNYVLIRVRDIHTTYTSDVSDGCYSRFVVEIQNVGVPLHNIAMGLSFSPGSGRASLGLRTETGQVVKEGQFHKGMITRFELRSDKLQPGDDRFLQLLNDVDHQFVTLTLFADGSRAWTYRFDRWCLRLMRVWNSLAGKVNSRCWRQVGTNPEGVQVVRYYSPLPKFFDRGFHLTGFIRHLSHGPFGPQSTLDATDCAGAWRKSASTFGSKLGNSPP